MTARLALVSDSHLSERTPEANTNWRALLDDFERRQPDAVIHTGDISLDGAGSRADLHHARAELDTVGGQLLALPGNHDLGDNPCETNDGYPSLINGERLTSYREIMGPDRWIHDVGSWRLVGCNAQLFNSGMDEEQEQWDWLERQLEPDLSAGRHTAVFLHKPLFHSSPHPAEHDVPIRYVRSDSRARMLSLLERVGASIVVSGHVHQYRQFSVGSMTHLWVPTSWATLSPEIQSLVGERWVGGLDLDLHDDGSVDVASVQPDAVAQNVIGGTIANPYDH